jgi:hypothetical protein
MTGSAAYATCPRFTEAARRCEAPAAVLELLEGGRKEAEQQQVRTERPKDQTLMAGRQAKERERESTSRS